MLVPRSERRLRVLVAGAGLSQQSSLTVLRHQIGRECGRAGLCRFKLLSSAHSNTLEPLSNKCVKRGRRRRIALILIGAWVTDRCDGVHDATASYDCKAAGSAQDMPRQQRHNSKRLPPRNRNRVPRPAQHPNQGLLPLRAIDDGAPEHARLRRLFGRARFFARRFKRCASTWIKGRCGAGLRRTCRNAGMGPQELSVPGPPEGLPDHAGEDAARAIR